MWLMLVFLKRHETIFHPHGFFTNQCLRWQGQSFNSDEVLLKEHLVIASYLYIYHGSKVKAI